MTNERVRGVREAGAPPRGRDEATTELSVPSGAPAPGLPPVGPSIEETHAPIEPSVAAPGVSTAADTLEHEAVIETQVRGVLIGTVGRLHSHIVAIVTGEGTLGRSPDNSYVIDDSYLSKQAARINADESGIAFECIEGAKGIEINGQPVAQSIWLRDGDRITLGSTLFSFRTTTPEGE